MLEVIDRSEQALAYWRGELDPPVSALDLPPRQAGQPRPGDDGPVAARLSPALMQKVAGLAQAERCSVAEVLMAALQAVLFRYTRSADLRVGLESGDAPMIVIRQQLAGAHTFRDVVRGVAAKQQAGRRHGMALRQLSERLRAMPLVQVAMRYGPARRELVLEPGLDLSLSFVDSTSGCACELKYDARLRDGAMARRLLGHFETLLEHGLEAPATPIGALRLLSASERAALEQWNRTDRPTARRPWHLSFEERVRQSPEAIAVSFGDSAWTYARLNSRANQLARLLQRAGVGPETKVGVCLERSVELLVALIAVAKAGGTYVPMDPGFPAERLRFMLQDSQAAVLVTDAARAEALQAGPQRVLLLEQLAGELEQEPETDLPWRGRPDALVYVMYTSGSTGQPKGVEVTHEALTNLLEAMAEAPGMTASDRLLAVTTVSFDIAALELYLPLMRGARVVLASRQDALDPQALARLVREQGVTVMQATPATWRMMLDAGWAGAPELTILCGGEGLPRTLADRLLPRCRALWNVYGPTETTVWSTAWTVEPAGPILVGRPIANTQLYILDEELQPVPAGVPGELYIGGLGLARGYAGRPERTRERFVANAGDPSRGGRMYRTGDLARFCDSGEVEHLGRTDFQVKVRGFRVELGEIEHQLERHAGVRSAVVVAQRETDGEPRLVAYVIPRHERCPEDLREHLAGRLPAYMVPAVFVPMTTFPMTANGKVDRNALPRPIAPESRQLAPADVPQGRLEQLIAEVWRKELGCGPVSRRDLFFELSGDSLQAARVITALQGELGIVAHVSALYDAPTVSGLAEYLGKHYPSEIAAFTDSSTVATSGPRLIDAARRERARAKVRQMLGGTAPPAKAPAPAPAKLRPLFLLSAARSGSTLLRVMLAGHSRLFAPPQLELLYFERLADWQRMWSGRGAIFQDGLVRTLRQARGLGLQAARDEVSRWVAEGLSVAAAYERIQATIGGRTLVDKSTAYALDLETLRHAEAWFEGARYVHLVRDPHASIASFVESRIDLAQALYQLDDDARSSAELQWLLSNENILAHLEQVPHERWRRVRYEDLVERPEPVMRELCDFLELDFEPSVLTPYDGQEARMVRGARDDEASRMVGDLKLTSYRDIRPELGAEKARALQGEPLGEPAVALARRLGYNE